MAESNLIKFKRGTQASLNTLMATKGGEDGCFYLTVDTNADTNKPISSKLYIGRATGEIVPVNQGIVTVSTTSDLSTLTANHTFTPGDFAYVETGNILAVYSQGKWIQINERPLDEYLKALETEATAASNTATVSITGTMSAGAPARKTEFSIAGTGGIDVTASDSTITIEGNEYSIAAAAKTGGGYDVQLSSTNSNTTSAVGFKPATNGNVSITESNGDLVFDSTDTRNDTVTFNNEDEGFSLDIKDTGGITKSGTVDPIITVGDTSKSSVHFVDGTATLPVYSKTDIDNKFKGVDAMTYKGLIGGTGGTAGTDISDIVTKKPHIGDTYKIGDPMPLPASYSSTGQAINMKVGDILIATGTEDPATGEITAATLKFDYIPAADDIEDTTYYVSTDTHSVGLYENGTNTLVGSMTLTAGNAITLTDTVTQSKNNSIEVAHSNVTRTDTTGTAADNATDGSVTIPVVTSVTTNAQGHVTAVETTNYSVDSRAKNLTAASFAAAGSNNSITVTGTYTVTDPFSNMTNNVTGTFTIASDNLTITASGSTVTVNNVWGTF